MRWPLHQMQRLADATKSFLGEALAPLRAVPGGLGPAGFVGDDGVPVPGSDLVAACDAIIPSMVERDPEWAGWCSVLVNVNDLTAMGAAPTGLLDAVGAPTRSLLTRIVRGIAKASQAWRVPVLGGHTQLGVPAVAGGDRVRADRRPRSAPAAARPATPLRLTADLTGGWRPGSPWPTMGFEQHPHAPTTCAELADAGGADGAAGGQGRQHGRCRRDRRECWPRPAGRAPNWTWPAFRGPPDADMGHWLTCFPGYAHAHRRPAGRRRRAGARRRGHRGRAAS